jgi:ABC-type transport system involved in cytochrome c biogenesis permease subunit
MFSIEKITIFCFAASYAVALGIELVQLLRPRAVQRLITTAFGFAGLLAHTLFLAAQRPPLASQFGSLLFLAWILAVFYIYGSVHHRGQAWGVFVLPVVLGLTVLAAAFDQPPGSSAGALDLLPADLEQFWNVLHVTLFILAAVGVSIAFMASLMYLVQAHRLKSKALPGQGLRLLSLERLEEMNRRGIGWAFPLLTAGLLIGMARMMQEGAGLAGWTDPRVVSTTVLWLLFALLLYLRYGFHLRGRRIALLTIMAFALLVVMLVTSHSQRAGGFP